MTGSLSFAFVSSRSILILSGSDDILALTHYEKVQIHRNGTEEKIDCPYQQMIAMICGIQLNRSNCALHPELCNQGNREAEQHRCACKRYPDENLLPSSFNSTAMFR